MYKTYRLLADLGRFLFNDMQCNNLKMYVQDMVQDFDVDN